MALPEGRVQPSPGMDSRQPQRPWGTGAALGEPCSHLSYGLAWGQPCCPSFLESASPCQSAPDRQAGCNRRGVISGPSGQDWGCPCPYPAHSLHRCPPLRSRLTEDKPPANLGQQRPPPGQATGETGANPQAGTGQTPFSCHLSCHLCSLPHSLTEPRRLPGRRLTYTCQSCKPGAAEAAPKPGPWGDGSTHKGLHRAAPLPPPLPLPMPPDRTMPASWEHTDLKTWVR
ncbi:uncharacterized protein LOC116660940 [Camelus ferus]|uniref:Uncharacterized protein LOC116660940 n=1 Tax=Camelus ferus TaxID=419612 RepID=A0A8B8SCI0_CAMFR|nr:uncharacterized protein LOC116660940 [Camelus ferus]